MEFSPANLDCVAHRRAPGGANTIHLTVPSQNRHFNVRIVNSRLRPGWPTQSVGCQGAGALPSGMKLVGVVPFMRKIPVPPVTGFQRSRSTEPSPLKSAVPATVHGRGRLPIPWLPVIVAPFMKLTSRSPVVGLYQRRSASPSPLKSPVPAIVQGDGNAPIAVKPVTVVPFNAQKPTSPVEVFCR